MGEEPDFLFSERAGFILALFFYRLRKNLFRASTGLVPRWSVCVGEDQPKEKKVSPIALFDPTLSLFLSLFCELSLTLWLRYFR